MKKFRCLLVKTVQYTPHYKEIEKVVICFGLDFYSAYEAVQDKFPDYCISMFWSVV
jgi:hypothetical protein